MLLIPREIRKSSNRPISILTEDCQPSQRLVWTRGARWTIFRIRSRREVVSLPGGANVGRRIGHWKPDLEPHRREQSKHCIECSDVCAGLEKTIFMGLIALDVQTRTSFRFF